MSGDIFQGILTKIDTGATFDDRREIKVALRNIALAPCSEVKDVSALATVCLMLMEETAQLRLELANYVKKGEVKSPLEHPRF